MLIGKFIKQGYLLPYRYQFHRFNYMIILLLEFNLFIIELLLPMLLVWGVLAFCICFLISACIMHTIEINRLKKLLYKRDCSTRISNMIASKISVYGLGILTIGVLISAFFRGYVKSVPITIQALGILIVWILINIFAIVVVIFVAYPYFLNAFYKRKYPEEYREWEGKSPEEWYGEKYLLLKTK